VSLRRSRRRPAEYWRGRLGTVHAARRTWSVGWSSYLKALAAGVAVVALALFVSTGPQGTRPLEWIAVAVTVGAAVVAVLYLSLPMRNRARHLFYDRMSDRPMGEYYETTTDHGVTVSLHALAFAAPSILVLVYLFFLRA
jgi:Na+/melibiose symporter-like transporter